MKHKKAVIEVSFSWVFMIIIGTFFIILSYNIISKYQENQELQSQIQLRLTLRNIFNKVGRTSGVEENSLTPLNKIFSGSEVRTECVDSYSVLYVDNVPDVNNEYLKNYPLVSNYIKFKNNDDAFLAVENFRLPFKITNIMAITSKRNLIVFDNNSKISKDLIKKFQSTSYASLNYVAVDFKDLTGFYDTNIYKKELSTVVFVSDYGVNPNNLKINSDIKYHFVKINKNSDFYGEISFYDINGKTKSFKYIDYEKSLVLPTISLFANMDSFECAYGKIVENVNLNYDFFIEKAKKYEDSKKNICIDSFNPDNQKSYYSSVREKMNSIKNIIKNDKFNNPENLKNSIDSLNELNFKLEEYSCPCVY